MSQTQRPMSVVTNLRAPYRDGVFALLEQRCGARIYMLADDEPGREWGQRTVPYTYRRVRSFRVGGAYGPHYFPAPTWVRDDGWILVLGLGLASLVSVTLRPRDTLVWNEGTPDTERHWDRGIRGVARRWIARRCAAGVAVGLESERYLRHLGCTKVVCLPNVIDDVRQSVPNATSGHDLVIAHVGDWSRRKGADLTADVFHRLSESTDACRVRLLIVGHEKDVPIPAGAEHLGYVDAANVWEALLSRGAGYLLLLSRREHWGFVVPEAMARGLIPLVSPKVGCAPDVVHPVSTSLIVSDPGSAARTISEIHADASKHRTLAASCLSVARQRSTNWAVTRFLTGVAELETGVSAAPKSGSGA